MDPRRERDHGITRDGDYKREQYKQGIWSEDDNERVGYILARNSTCLSVAQCLTLRHDYRG